MPRRILLFLAWAALAACGAALAAAPRSGWFIAYCGRAHLVGVFCRTGCIDILFVPPQGPYGFRAGSLKRASAASPPFRWGFSLNRYFPGSGGISLSIPLWAPMLAIAGLLAWACRQGPPQDEPPQGFPVLPASRRLRLPGLRKKR